VHGTTQSPDGWAPVMQQLRASGHDCVTVDLGDGRIDASPQRLAQIASEQIGADPVDAVVAHSGSGLLLPAIAAAVASRHHIYLAAVIPGGAESFLDELSAASGTIVQPAWTGVDPTADPVAAHRFLFHDCAPDVEEWALTTLRPFIPIAAYSAVIEPSRASAAVIVPAADRTLRPDWMIHAARIRLCVEPHVIADAGHCPHVSRPDEVAALLVEIATD